MPFIVRWPGRVPAGRVEDKSIISAVDLLPTLCALSGAAVPKDHKLDGIDVSAVWRGGVAAKRAPLFWEYGRNDDAFKFGPDRSPNVAVRRDDWKMLINADGSRPELYNLATDPKEARNVITERPDVARELTQLALEWRRALPKKN